MNQTIMQDDQIMQRRQRKTVLQHRSGDFNGKKCFVLHENTKALLLTAPPPAFSLRHTATPPIKFILL
jgi:hypothetical protein